MLYPVAQPGLTVFRFPLLLLLIGGMMAESSGRSDFDPLSDTVLDVITRGNPAADDYSLFDIECTVLDSSEGTVFEPCNIRCESKDSGIEAAILRAVNERGEKAIDGDADDHIKLLRLKTRLKLSARLRELELEAVIEKEAGLKREIELLSAAAPSL